MILKFDEYILNEGVQSAVKLSEVKKLIIPFGWIYTRGDGDSCKFTKGKYVLYFHLKHDASIDENRSLDVGGLDILRTYLIDEFHTTGDLTLIKLIPWQKWRLPSPLKRELKNIDPKTGKERVTEPELNIGQKLYKARVEKEIRTANELYKDAQLWKIDEKDENSFYIMMNLNDDGVMKYNTCRSPKDRRPILKDWYDSRTNYKKIGGKYYFGRDYMSNFSTRFFRVLVDGTLDKKENESLRESKKLDKNLEML